TKSALYSILKEAYERPYSFGLLGCCVFAILVLWRPWLARSYPSLDTGDPHASVRNFFGVGHCRREPLGAFERELATLGSGCAGRKVGGQCFIRFQGGSFALALQLFRGLFGSDFLKFQLLIKSRLLA